MRVMKPGKEMREDEEEAKQTRNATKYAIADRKKYLYIYAPQKTSGRAILETFEFSCHNSIRFWSVMMTCRVAGLSFTTDPGLP